MCDGKPPPAEGEFRILVQDTNGQLRLIIGRWDDALDAEFATAVLNAKYTDGHQPELITATRGNDQFNW